MNSNVFDYLNNDMSNIVQRLDATASHYADWPRDRIFEQTKKELAALKIHFSKEALLEQNLKNPNGTQGLIDKARKQREVIAKEVEDLVMIHVDEPGFEQGLESITEKLGEHMNFCAATFFPSLKEHLTNDDMQHIGEQLDQMVLS
ncbi:MAG TPA: hypothetical protein V6C72_10550 [Chroococcales cyanobacterium]